MDEALGARIGGEKSPSGIKAPLAPTVAPGESVLWTGRPVPASLVRRSIPKALIGLLFVAFTLIWMAAVVRGGHNNWDRGQAVIPFATHNVLIATCAGLWLLPPGLYLLTWPLRTWRKARRTVYALTDRRAVVSEPGLLGGHGVHSYPPESLTLMRCDEREDGSGDLIFEHRKTWVGMPQAVGFLAIGRVREVEALVRAALLSDGPHQARSPRPHATPPAGGRTYRISDGFRLHQLVGLAVGVISAFCLVGNLALAIAALVIMPRIAFGALASFAAESGWPGPLGVAGCLVAGVGSLFVAGLVAWLAFRFALATPTEIAVGGDGRIEFRSKLRTVALRAGEITSITTGGWADPNRFQAVIRHEGGKVVLVNQFPDFRDFLATVKALNPAVDVNGF